MPEFDPVAGTDALAKAVEIDNQLWATTKHGSRSKLRKARDQAILEAVNAGMSLEFIADRMGVLVSDVERMAGRSRPV